MSTTIKLEMETKEALDDFREHSRESYDKVVRKLLYIARIAKKEPRLSKKTVLEIEEARKRI
ncbi:MAG TPA: hypothetical protein VJI67_00520, partial [archaeon]|nr:hypothetical protein [archaeon]